MDHSGGQLGADLYALLEVARHYLPSASQEYHKAYSDLNAWHSLYRNDYLGDAMNQSTIWGLPNHLTAEWTEAVDHIRGMVNDTATNLDSASAALERIVQYYAETDGGAADALQRALGPNGPKPDPAHVG